MKNEIEKTITDYINHITKLSNKMLSPEDQAIVDSINYEAKQLLAINLDKNYEKLQYLNGRLLTIENRY